MSCVIQRRPPHYLLDVTSPLVGIRCRLHALRAITPPHGSCLLWMRSNQCPICQYSHSFLFRYLLSQGWLATEINIHSVKATVVLQFSFGWSVPHVKHIIDSVEAQLSYCLSIWIPPISIANVKPTWMMQYDCLTSFFPGDATLYH